MEKAIRLFVGYAIVCVYIQWVLHPVINISFESRLLDVRKALLEALSLGQQPRRHGDTDALFTIWSARLNFASKKAAHEARILGNYSPNTASSINYLHALDK